MTSLAVVGYTIERVGPADAARVQPLFERCSDYMLLEEGEPTRPEAAEHSLTVVPAGRDFADKFSFIISSDSAIIGAIDIFRDYPKPNEWWLGLLLLDPATRGRGLGSRVMDALREWLVAQDAHTLWLAVLETNPRAERFWRAQGFAETERQPFTAATGFETRVVLMKAALAAA
ncbi:MAG TPA: GNAT family N-acetyltransferase [Thermoanaerobaculia bacterium]|nr:GNAT family N-acetyltransferase [Thermoanaerobaculia bacterium]